jgi:hypothetical protein
MRKKGSPMVEDLLSRIEQELYERIEELYPAVDECDRLQADLEALEALPEPPIVSEPPVAPDIINLESPVAFESPVILEVATEPPYEPESSAAEPEPAAALNVDSEPLGTVLCFPGNRKPTRTVAVSPQDARPISTLSRPASVPTSEPMVSPKVARLMLAPRRPALERSGIPRVGALV